MYFIWGSVALAIAVMVWLAMTDRRGRRRNPRNDADGAWDPATRARGDGGGDGDAGGSSGDGRRGE
jgi:hypothetical protein